MSKLPTPCFFPDPYRSRKCTICRLALEADHFFHTYEYTCIECYNKRRVELEDVIKNWIIAHTPSSVTEAKTSATTVKELVDALAALSGFLHRVQKPFSLPSRE
ncbi:uncharacterized protein UTRI_01789_B [Ustilago trichophora]|uniref:Uncharacterized protein n=1 Tax=Ustilago trichophora TaxID=86804 RepID=A0A5C3E258_9BASI|nr:uncharacterized protein UTRI_01789_B [Ustilago trichophora]